MGNGRKEANGVNLREKLKMKMDSVVVEKQHGTYTAFEDAKNTCFNWTPLSSTSTKNPLKSYGRLAQQLLVGSRYFLQTPHIPRAFFLFFVLSLSLKLLPHIIIYKPPLFAHILFHSEL